MKYNSTTFEVQLPGFNGATDRTYCHVLWVRACCAAHVAKHYPEARIDTLDFNPPDCDIDADLTKDPTDAT